MKVREPIGGGVSREGLTSSPPIDTRGVEVRPMSVVGNMRGQRGRNGSVKRIYVSGYPGQAGRPDTSKTSEIVYCAQFLDKPWILFLLGIIITIPLLGLIDSFSSQTSFLNSSYQLRLFVIGDCLYPFSPLCRLPIGRASLSLVLMDTLLDF